jgi:long-subunit acyl-CoA synthetase (AMP-forming)
MTTCYSQSVPHTRTKDSTAIRRTHLAELVGKLSHRGSLTLFETFSKSAQEYADRRCLGYRPIDTLNSSPGRYLFRTYAEVSRSVRNIASGLVKEGLILPNHDGFLVLGLYLKNSCAWVMAENACYYLNAVVIPLYDTLGADTVEYIVNQTGIQTIICSAKELSSLASVASSCPTLGAVVVADLSVPHVACLEVMKDANIKVFSLHRTSLLYATHQGLLERHANIYYNHTSHRFFCIIFHILQLKRMFITHNLFTLLITHYICILHITHISIKEY